MLFNFSDVLAVTRINLVTYFELFDSNLYTDKFQVLYNVHNLLTATFL